MKSSITMEDKSLSILLVEQDVNWGRFLQSYLEHKGISIDLSMDGKEAWQKMLQGKYNFCLINPVLPSVDGCALAAQIKEHTPHVPIVFVASAQQDSEALRIRCFEAGADDYVTRPCSVDEIILRIIAIRKRFQFCPLDDYKVFDLGKLRFDYAKRRIYNQDCNMRLTTKESELLLALCLNRGRVLEREEALLAVWKSKELYNSRSMDVYVSKLRRLLYDYTYSEIINIHGVGFKLVTHRDAEFRNELRRDAGLLRKLPRRHPRKAPLAAATANNGLVAEVAESMLREPDEALRESKVPADAAPSKESAAVALPSAAPKPVAPTEVMPSEAASTQVVPTDVVPTEKSLAVTPPSDVSDPVALMAAAPSAESTERTPPSAAPTPVADGHPGSRV